MMIQIDKRIGASLSAYLSWNLMKVLYFKQKKNHKSMFSWNILLDLNLPLRNFYSNSGYSLYPSVV